MGDTKVFPMNSYVDTSGAEASIRHDAYSVVIRKLFKSYHSEKHVLNELNMTVKRGHIYTVLGSSGCGKTTLLSCIVGVKRCDSGKIQVFGKKPGLETKNRIGYMPQENALYQHLTILETCKFFGHMHNMSTEKLEQQVSFLTVLLDLPNTSKQVRNLSGGEARRVSLAVAMLHNADLLVLDEPTVGLDPLLRTGIWEYLKDYVKRTRTSIIITTHYNEEAQRSDMVGVLRNGRFIVENTPENLLQAYNSDSLEQSMLQICHEDESAVKNEDLKDGTFSKITSFDKSSGRVVFKSLAGDFSEHDLKGDEYKQIAPQKLKFGKLNLMEFACRVYAHTMAMMLTFLRLPAFLVFILICPSIQGAVVLITMGAKMSGMHLGVVNHEINDWKNECNNRNRTVCDWSGLTCLYLDQLQSGDLFVLDSYDSEASAIAGIQLGNSWGYLKFPENYSQHTMIRFATRGFATNESIEGSIIKFRLDQSQTIATYLMQKKIYGSFLSFVQELSEICWGGKASALNPLQYRPPVYGTNEDNFMLFILPGELLINVMFLCCALTGLMFITDWKLGTLSRARVAGLQTIDLLTSHILTQLLIAVGQLCIRTMVVYFLFQVEIKGPLVLYSAIWLLTGVCGAMLGLLIGLICLEEVRMLVVGTFLTVPFIFFGEVPFPKEFNAKYWQWVGLVIPTRLSAASLRSVIIRGLGLSHPLVWPGICVILIWIIVLIVLDAVLCKKLLNGR